MSKSPSGAYDRLSDVQKGPEHRVLGLVGVLELQSGLRVRVKVKM